METNNNFPPIPGSWSELISLREYLRDCSKYFLRTQEDQEKYDRYSKSLTREEIIDDINKKLKGQKVAMLINEYPHTNLLSYLPNAKHYSLWSTRGELPDEEIRKFVNKEITKDWFYMTRKKGFMSIPEIWHTHIYVNLNS